MNEKEFFRLALGLAAPWQVEKIEFFLEEKRLEITRNFPVGSRFPCPECGRSCEVYDTEERTWRHLNFFQHETYLPARQPRLECDEHKVGTAEAPK